MGDASLALKQSDTQSIMNKRFCLQTGQTSCHDTAGDTIPYPGIRQDGEFHLAHHGQAATNAILKLWERNCI